jgi:hypothetical protein
VGTNGGACSPILASRFVCRKDNLPRQRQSNNVSNPYTPDQTSGAASSRRASSMVKTIAARIKISGIALPFDQFG